MFSIILIVDERVGKPVTLAFDGLEEVESYSLLILSGQGGKLFCLKRLNIVTGIVILMHLIRFLARVFMFLILI